MASGITSLVGTARRIGLLDPLTSGALATATAAWGPTIAAGFAASSVRHPNRIAVVDDVGMLTFGELEWRALRVAGALRHRGVARGDAVGILCRNHRGFVEASLAVAKLGARPVMLNTTLAERQLGDVVASESVRIVIADSDLAPLLHGASGSPDAAEVSVIVADPGADASWSFPELQRRRPLVGVPGPANAISPTLLTSGTTGTPKGARRTISAAASDAALGVLEAIPYRNGDVMALPAPLFHAWGFSQLVLAGTLANTVILRQRFDPTQTLDDMEAHGATVLGAVPVMLHRLLEQRAAEAGTAAETAGERDLPALRVVATSGSALPGELAVRWMDAFGDNLYNLYGSTEVGQVSVASPSDLRAVPDTAGRALRGVHISVLDDDDRPVGAGVVGEVLVESSAGFDGYTGGGTKRMVGELMSTGDRGFLDGDGRLCVVGRADDMIISGGENLYPSSIERSLLRHDAVTAAAVVGVDDAELGQRVRAVVVTDSVSDTGDATLTSALKAHLRSELAAHEMPRQFVYVTELPRNAAGKVVRSELSGSRQSVPHRVSPTRRKKSKSKKQPDSR